MLPCRKICAGMIQSSSDIRSGGGRLREFCILLWKALTFPARQSFRSARPGSSGAGSSASNLQKLTGGNSVWLEAKRISNGSSAEEIRAWAESLGLGREETGMFYIHVNGSVLAVKAESNSSSEALLQLLKTGDITIAMHDYGSFEKVDSLGADIPRNDEDITTVPGDVILYQGNQVTIYYDENRWNFTRLGHIDMDQDELKSILGSGDVTVILSVNP